MQCFAKESNRESANRARSEVRTKIEGLKLFLKFILSLARALASDTTLTVLIPIFAPLLRLLIFKI